MKETKRKTTVTRLAHAKYRKGEDTDETNS